MPERREGDVRETQPFGHGLFFGERHLLGFCSRDRDTGLVAALPR